MPQGAQLIAWIADELPKHLPEDVEVRAVMLTPMMVNTFFEIEVGAQAQIEDLKLRVKLLLVPDPERYEDFARQGAARLARGYRDLLAS